jgi:hypothetical protein
MNQNEKMFFVTALTRDGFEDSYEWADTAAEAIAKVRAEFGYDLLSVSVRRALYGEWKCNQTISGQCSVCNDVRKLPNVLI